MTEEELKKRAEQLEKEYKDKNAELQKHAQTLSFLKGKGDVIRVLSNAGVKNINDLKSFLDLKKKTFNSTNPKKGEKMAEQLTKEDVQKIIKENLEKALSPISQNVEKTNYRQSVSDVKKELATYIPQLDAKKYKETINYFKRLPDSIAESYVSQGHKDIKSFVDDFQKDLNYIVKNTSDDEPVSSKKVEKAVSSNVSSLSLNGEKTEKEVINNKKSGTNEEEEKMANREKNLQEAIAMTMEQDPTYSP